MKIFEAEMRETCLAPRLLWIQELSGLLAAEVSKLQESMAKFSREEQAAREAGRQAMEAAQLRRHEEMSEELRRAHRAQTEERLGRPGSRTAVGSGATWPRSRQWAQSLVERLSADLRGEREALFQELNRRCEELGKLNAEHVRMDRAGRWPYCRGRRWPRR